MQLIVTSGLLDQIRNSQTEAIKEENVKRDRIVGQLKDLVDGNQGLKTRFGRIWVPNSCGAKALLLEEAHKSHYSIHPGETKMYNELKQNYWWPGMKRDIVNYQASIGMAPYEMLYGRKCRTPVCWGEVGPRGLAPTDLIRTTNEKIDLVRTHLKAAQDRQKSYADKRRRPIEFQGGDKVMLKVSLWKGIIRFRKRGKLSPRYIGPFRITERVGKVAYHLELPKELSGIHSTFHVSHLRKCLADETAHVHYDDIEVDNSLNYAVQPIAILDRKAKSLRNKEINQVKVKWEHRKGAGTTWESEEEMQRLYPMLFGT
ncbi:uncharacterized protein LOC110933247 [Helianthus annuus]|uniref:uncharacterized protein LOC110933247 n=1 Tax=Helianthus annuus TaxID=4232 RepID=UPI000B907FA4|nr:uncharacterized protein LOC110933247 [Helianthus annuus]